MSERATESVWDYPRPPRIEPVDRRVRVEHDGELVADSRRALRVLETASPPTIYVPASDVRTELLHEVGSGRAHIAFYAGRVDACYLDGERVRPQGGNFYGGWITDEIEGPYKGGPDTEGW